MKSNETISYLAITIILIHCLHLQRLTFSLLFYSEQVNDMSLLFSTKNKTENKTKQTNKQSSRPKLKENQTNKPTQRSVMLYITTTDKCV